MFQLEIVNGKSAKRKNIRRYKSTLVVKRTNFLFDSISLLHLLTVVRFVP